MQIILPFSAHEVFCPPGPGALARSAYSKAVALTTLAEAPSVMGLDDDDDDDDDDDELVDPSIPVLASTLFHPLERPPRKSYEKRNICLACAAFPPPPAAYAHGAALAAAARPPSSKAEGCLQRQHLHWVYFGWLGL